MSAERRIRRVIQGGIKWDHWWLVTELEHSQAATERVLFGPVATQREAQDWLDGSEYCRQPIDERGPPKR